EQPLDLIIWPETAVPYLLEDAGLILEEAIFNSGGVPLATGVQRAEGPLYFNSLIVTDAFGAVQSTYDKHHLVPFGEYFPFGDFLARFGITAFAARYGRGYTPGPGAVVLDLGAAGKVLPLICYEAVFPQDLNAAAERADWILQITNDGWFGTQAGPYQHLAQARLRAIEQGLPLMRVANTGVTAAIDAKGRVTQSLALGEVGWLDVAVPTALAPTLYARTGDGLATILVMLSLLALALWRGKRSD
ncbi:MAG: apolipoprotein N-acyltransferase, partial [Albidovulum sp.]